MNYVEENAHKLIESMEKDGDIVRKVPTCDHSNWDREYHHMFPQIAQKIREKGYNVTSKVNWGVTDWVITKVF